jgi:hypothetical protein
LAEVLNSCQGLWGRFCGESLQAYQSPVPGTDRKQRGIASLGLIGATSASSDISLKHLRRERGFNKGQRPAPHASKFDWWRLHGGSRRYRQRIMDSTKERDVEEHQAFLPPTHANAPLPREKQWRRPSHWLRLAFECAMALTIVGLLFRPPAALCRREGPPSPVPHCERLPRNTSHPHY